MRAPTLVCCLHAAVPYPVIGAFRVEKGGKEQARGGTEIGMQTRTTADANVEDVARWREEQLSRSGFSPTLAAEIANDTRYDLHALIELVERGCRPDLAVRILGPLPRGRAA